MAKTIDQLLNEADEILEKRASDADASQEKTASQNRSDEDEDIFKLAEDLRNAQQKTASDEEQPSPELNMNLSEKIAHSMAIVDTIVNLPLLSQLSEFEKKAQEKGYSEEQIAEYSEKIASGKVKTIATLLGTGAATGGAGYAYGKDKGEEEGKKQGRREGALVGMLASRKKKGRAPSES